MALNIYHQDGTAWRKTGKSAYGEETFGEPIAIRCRYEKGGKLEIDPGQKEFVASGKFFCETEFAPEDMFAPGTHTGTPQSANAKEIAVVRVTPNISNTFSIIQHWLR